MSSALVVTLQEEDPAAQQKVCPLTTTLQDWLSPKQISSIKHPAPLIGPPGIPEGATSQLHSGDPFKQLPPPPVDALVVAGAGGAAVVALAVVAAARVVALTVVAAAGDPFSSGICMLKVKVAELL